jgi:hypothetical protein
MHEHIIRRDGLIEPLDFDMILRQPDAKLSRMTTIRREFIPRGFSTGHSDNFESRCRPIRQFNSESSRSEVTAHPLRREFALIWVELLGREFKLLRDHYHIACVIDGLIQVDFDPH